MDTRGGPSKLSLRAERVGSCSRLIHKQSWTGLYREACNFASKVVVQHSFSNRFVTFPWDFSYFTIYFKRGCPVPVHAAKSAFPGIEIGTLIPLLRISIFCHLLALYCRFGLRTVFLIEVSEQQVGDKISEYCPNFREFMF